MHLRLLSLLFFSLTGMSVTVVDVRTQDEWNRGHLEGALHIEWQDILNLSSDINKDEKIYLYCRSGYRSRKATKILEDAGYINVVNAGSIQEASKLLRINIIN
jgi:rhodanese-related sulfurtransferase